MADFPSITATLGSGGSLYSPLIKSESEGNYTKVRRVTTKSRRKFDLKFDNISLANYQTLEDFFDANQGLSFNYTDPRTSTTFTCVFVDNEMTYKHISATVVSTSIKMEEVG